MNLLERGVTSDRIILIGDSTGGNVMLALSRWIRDEGLLRQPAGVLLLSVSVELVQPTVIPSSLYSNPTALV